MAAKKLSVEEILAACRNADGDGSGGDATPAPEESSAPAAAPSPPAAATGPPAKLDPSKMSVADMLAAARGEKSGDGAAAEEAVEEAAPAAASATPAEKLDPSKMSVADMLAAARGEKSKPAAKPAPKKPAAAAKPAAKASPKAPAEKQPAPDTSSILAAARRPAKRGPMSKSEAAEKGVSTKPKRVAPPMPEKPAYAKPKPVAAGDEDRRGFMSLLFGSALAIGFGSLATVTGLWTLGLARFFFPNILTEPPSVFKIGFTGDFPPDTVATKFKAQFGIWVVNAEYEGQRQITALKSVCTHLGCTPNWLEGEQKFKCPCHGSGFYKDGINFEGPAPRPLERYAIRVADDGQLEVDKSKTFQQEMGAWKDGACYVKV